MTRIIIFSLFLIAFYKNAYALSDLEFKESKKCSIHFSYFEKKYNIPKDTLYSISLQETKKKHKKLNIQLVWPWTVNVAGVGYHFDTKDEAIKFTQKKQEEGINSIDVGCMQINLKHHPDAFTSLEQAFSPRRNVAYGAKHLKEKYNANGNWEKAIGHYHSYDKSRSRKYYQNVSLHADTMEDYRLKMNKLSRQRLFEVNSTNDRFVVSNESAMPNVVKIHKASTKDKGLTDHHWFRKNSSIPSM